MGHRLIPLILCLLTVPCLGESEELLDNQPTTSLQDQLADVERQFRIDWGGVIPAELAPASVPEEDNRAALVVQAAIGLAKFRERGTSERDLIASLTNEYDLQKVRTNLEQIDAILFEFRDVLSIADRIPSRGRSSYDIDYTSSWRDYGVRLIYLVDLLRLRAARSLVSLERGDKDDAVKGVQTLLAISDSLAAEPDGMLQSLRVAATLHALGVLREIFAAGHNGTPHLPQIQRQLTETAEHRAVDQLLRGELMSHLSQIDTFVREAQEENWDPFELAEMRAAMRIKQLGISDRWMRYAYQPAHERGAPPVETIPEAYEQRQYEDELLNSLDRATSIGTINLEGAVTNLDLDETRTRLAVAALAVERFAHDHGGSFPGSLSELVPRHLKTEPIDPFTGEPFEYRRTEDGYRLVASPAAIAAGPAEHRDPVLDWSRPRGVRHTDE